MSDQIRRFLGSSTAGRQAPGCQSGCGGCGALVILGGLALILASVLVLVLNEGQAVSTYRTLIEGTRIVQSIRADAVDPAHDGQLVHLVGLATTMETLQDPELGVSAPALRLRRKVEMYQWAETEHNTSSSSRDSTTSTYTYRQLWSERPISSVGFHNSFDHRNPDTMPYTSITWVAKTVSLGAYTLSASLVDQIDTFQQLAVDIIPMGIDRKGQIYQGGFYVGDNPALPKIGDLRIAYTQVTPTTVSVIAQASGSTLAPYPGKAGDTINLLETGEHSAATMFATAQDDNVLETWLVRMLGAFMMLMGFQALNQPIVGLLRLIPGIGNAAPKGVGCLAGAVVATLIALPLSAVLSIAGWLFFHVVS